MLFIAIVLTNSNSDKRAPASVMQLDPDRVAVVDWNLRDKSVRDAGRTNSLT